MSLFQDLIYNLETVGFFQYFLPFVLVIAVFYGLLRKFEIFEDQAVDATVSIVAAFLAMFGLAAVVPASTFSQFFGVLVVIIMVLLGYDILLGMIGIDISDITNPEEGADSRRIAWASGIGVVLVVVVVTVFYGWGGRYMMRVLLSEDALSVYLILGMLGVIYSITSEGGGE